MIVEVLVAQGDRQYPLSQHSPLGVRDRVGLAWVPDAGVDGVDQSDALVDLPQQQGAGVGGDLSAVEISLDSFSLKAGKEHWLLGALCHLEGLSICGSLFL